MDRITKKKRRKKKKILRWLLILSLILASGVGYAFYQYYQGFNNAGQSAITNKNYKFNGKVDKNGKVNVLLLGIDTRGEKKSRTDTIMVAQYDPKTHKAKLVSIMRDIYAQIPGYENYKINTAYFLGGPELLRQTIKQNFDIDVQYYALIDFKGFTKLIDALAPDGIQVDVKEPMSEHIGVSLQPGVQKLHGKELLGFARFRHDAEGDFGRVERQQEVISALKDKLLSVNGITKLPMLAGTITPYIETNMSTMDGLALMKDMILHPPGKIETLRIPIKGSYTNGYYKHAGDVLDIDFDKNKQALKDFLDGNPDTNSGSSSDTANQSNSNN